MLNPVKASDSHTKMSWKRAKSPGWAAFDLKQQNKQGFKLEGGDEPYPPISSTISPLQPNQNLLNNNNAFSVGSFSNVLLPSVNFPSSTLSNDIEKPLQLGDCSANVSNKLVGDTNKANTVVQAYEKLKKLHSWADKSLIEDIMEAVNNDTDEASNLLNEMVSTDNFEKNKETNIVDLEYNSKDFLLDGTKDLEGGSNYNIELMDGHISGGKTLGDHGRLMEQMLGNLRFIPVEPEWEEDDIYLIHRKDAVRMMRSAARHSKAANEAYLRGDHIFAQQCSLKAKEEWEAAEKINAEAAKQILSIRNCKNDAWTLDLHGLHAVEAVEALRGHLQKIESRGTLNRSSSPNGVNAKTGMVRSASLESSSRMDMEKLDKQPAPSRQRSTLLQVITGRGNHSKGQAALPVAIRNFLTENRYHYDEARPGVITVRPKFRRG